MLTSRFYYELARTVWWWEIEVEDLADRALLSPNQRSNGELVRKISLTTKNNTNVPSLESFPGLQKCYWNAMLADRVLFPQIIKPFTDLLHLTSLHLCTAVNLSAAPLALLAPRLKHLNVFGARTTSQEFIDLLSVGWLALETLVLTLACSTETFQTPTWAPNVPDVNTLHTFYISVLPHDVDFSRIFAIFPCISTLTILNISGTHDDIDQAVLPQLACIRAPVVLLRRLICHRPIKIMHVVGGMAEPNGQQSLDFLRGKFFKAIVCEQGLQVEHIRLMMHEPELEVEEIIVIKRICMNPVRDHS